jgi:hypothetical protein
MSYTLKFSDPNNSNTVIVPDMPPGINTIDTSLALVGRGYPNYGERIAENFLNLLENFASPNSPHNPIQGQLWYDNSTRTLRVNDGTGWASANGIYQQDIDPMLSNSVGLRNGDIWVDTALNQLKIYSVGSWTLVGPATTSTSSAQSGPEVALVYGTDRNSRRIIKNWSDGSVVAIVAADSFTPNPVIDGFSSLMPGINLSTNLFNSAPALFNGESISSQSLNVSGLKYSASRFLRKDDSTSMGQVITGKVVYQTPSDQTGAQGRDGVVINYQNNYIQLYKNNKDAILLNNEYGGKLIFRVQTGNITDCSLNNALVVEDKKVRIDGDLYLSGSIYPNSVDGFVEIGTDIFTDTTSTSVQYITFVSTSSNRTPIKAAPISGLVYVPNPGLVGINTNYPRGTLDVVTTATVHGSDTIVLGIGNNLYPTPQYSGNASIVFKGLVSDARLTSGDSSGVLNSYWNAYEDSSGVLNYMVSNVPAARQTINITTSTSYWSFSGATVGTAGSPTVFVQSAHIEPSSKVWFSARGIPSDFYVSEIGNIGFNTSEPRGKVDIVTTSTTLGNDTLTLGVGNTLYPSLQHAGNGVITFKGITSDVRVIVQDGHGAFSTYWNAYEDPTTTLNYIVSNVPAAKETIDITTSTSFWSFSGAALGTAGSSINFVKAAHIEPSNKVWFSPRGISSDLNVANTGNVGINTNSPRGLLDITNPATTYSNDTLVIGGGNISYPSPQHAGVAFKGTNTDARLTVQDSGGSVNLYWNTYEDTTKTLNYIASNIPAAKETIDVTTSAAFWSFSGANSGTAGSPVVFTQSAHVEPTKQVWFSARGQSGDLYISNTGSVGINTNSPSPSFNLDVNGSTNISGNLNINGTIFVKGNPLAGLPGPVGPAGAAGPSGPTWVPPGAANEVLFKDTNNNAMSSANFQFDGLNVTVAGDITAFFSDDRLKTRIGVIENALEKVNKLTGFYYQPNQIAQDLGYSNKKEVGVSAQEVQAVLPEVVVPAPIDPQYLTVNYEKIIPLLIEAIKELSSELNYVRSKIQ